MDEEMKNPEQAPEEMKNEAGNIFDQLKEMLGQTGSDGVSIFDQLKGMFEGKEGEPGMLDQLKEMVDKGTTAAGEVSQEFLEKARDWLRECGRG